MERKNDIRVQIVSSFFPTDKETVTASFIFNEVYALSKLGVQTYVTTCCYGRNVDLDGIHVHRIPRGKFEVPSYISRMYGMPEMLVFPEPIFLWPLSSYCISRYRDEIIREARTHRVDLVHAHFAYPEGYAAMLAKTAAEKPLVVSLRGYDIQTEPSIKYGARLKKHLDNCVRSSLAAADKVMVASTPVFNEALKIGINREKLVLVANGVNIHMFNPMLDGSTIRRRLGIGGGSLILFVGGLLPVKGIPYLLKAIQSVISVYPNATLAIVGKGPQQRPLEQLSRKLGIRKNVIFTGEIPHARTPFFFAACDIFVLPSIIEGFGNVTLEAMATGKPVVATRVGGAFDIIEDGANGYLAEPKNPSEIADRIIRLLSDPGKREAMGRKARKSVEEKFSMDVRSRKTIDIYESVL